MRYYFFSKGKLTEDRKIAAQSSASKWNLSRSVTNINYFCLQFKKAREKTHHKQGAPCHHQPLPRLISGVIKTKQSKIQILNQQYLFNFNKNQCTINPDSYLIKKKNSYMNCTASKKNWTCQNFMNIQTTQKKSQDTNDKNFYH